MPGRDLYVQGWYQGGVDVMDFTDADHPTEIAYFDRGPIDPPPGASTVRQRRDARRAHRCTIGGSWGAYYWNGMIYSSELDRGFDVFELTPSAQLSANEIAAAKLVRFKEYNPTSQPKLVWPPAFVVVRSYLDQLVRNDGLAADRTAGDLGGARRGGAEERCGARRGAHRAREAGGRRRERGEGRGARAHDGGRDQTAGGGTGAGVTTGVASK